MVFCRKISYSYPAAMKNINSPGLFDEQFQLERLSQLKDPLVKMGLNSLS
jgi:hypothetical protein